MYYKFHILWGYDSPTKAFWMKNILLSSLLLIFAYLSFKLKALQIIISSCGLVSKQALCEVEANIFLSFLWTLLSFYSYNIWR